jgi:hypothetical protein
MKKMKLKFLLLLLLPLFFIGCGDDTDNPDADLTCFEGDIVLLGDNVLPANAKIVTAWISFSNSTFYLFGDATIDFDSKTFKVCYNETELPENFTLLNVGETRDDYFSLGLIKLTTSSALINGMYLYEDEDFIADLNENTIATTPGFYIVYTTDKYRAYNDSLVSIGLDDFLPDFTPGFKQGECSDNPGGTGIDDIIPSSNRLKLYIGTEEELEAEGIDTECNWS